MNELSITMERPVAVLRWRALIAELIDAARWAEAGTAGAEQLEERIRDAYESFEVELARLVDDPELSLVADRIAALTMEVSGAAPPPLHEHARLLAERADAIERLTRGKTDSRHLARLIACAADRAEYLRRIGAAVSAARLRAARGADVARVLARVARRTEHLEPSAVPSDAPAVVAAIYTLRLMRAGCPGQLRERLEAELARLDQLRAGSAAA